MNTSNRLTGFSERPSTLQLANQDWFVIKMVMPSRRERIKQLLRESRNPLSVEDIVALLGEHTDLKSVYEDLQHIAKSVRGESKGEEYLVMIPPTCRVWGFTFKRREKSRPATRCPRCKSERISSRAIQDYSKMSDSDSPRT